MKARQKKKQAKIAQAIDQTTHLAERLAVLEARLASAEVSRRAPDPVVIEPPVEEAPPPTGSVSWFDDRFYRIDINGRAEFFPSVTTVLGAAYPHQELERWRARLGYQQANQIMREAADKGTAIHNACHVYATGGLVHFQTHGAMRTREQLAALRELNNGNMAVLYDQEHMLHADRFARWLDAVKAEVRAAECTIYSLTHRIAGTLDLLVHIPGGTYMVNGSDPVKIPEGLYVVDIKTGNGVWDSHYIQIATYAAMLADDENAPVEVAGGIILHTGATTRSGIPGVATHMRTRVQMREDFSTFLHALHLFHAAAPTKPRIYELPTMLKRR